MGLSVVGLVLPFRESLLFLMRYPLIFCVACRLWVTRYADDGRITTAILPWSDRWPQRRVDAMQLTQRSVEPVASACAGTEFVSSWMLRSH